MPSLIIIYFCNVYFPVDLHIIWTIQNFYRPRGVRDDHFYEAHDMSYLMESINFMKMHFYFEVCSGTEPQKKARHRQDENDHDKLV